MVDSAPQKHFSENPDGTIPRVWNIPRPPTRKIPKELADRRSAAISELIAMGNFPHSQTRPLNLKATQREIDARDPHDPFRKYNWNHRLRTAQGRSRSVPIELKQRIGEIRREWLNLTYADIRVWESQRAKAIEQYLENNNLKHPDIHGNLLLLSFALGPLALACTFVVEFFTPKYNLPGWIWGATIISSVGFVLCLLTMPKDGPAGILNRARPINSRRR